MFRPWMLAGLAAVAAFLLQLFPLTGIFLMLVGAILWVGVLIHVMMILLVIDWRAGKTHPAFLALPILFYGGGLAAFAISWVSAFALSARLGADDVRAPVGYDPARQVVVFHDSEARSGNAIHRAMQADYALDVVFASDEHNEIAPYAVNLVTARDDCETLRSGGSGISGLYPEFRGQRVGNACMLRAPMVPAGETVDITSTTHEEQWGLRTAQVMRTVVRNGDREAVLNTAQMQVYPPVPMFFAGCGLNSAEARWQCGADFFTYHHAVGAGGDLNAALARVLGLGERRLERGGIVFAPHPRQAAIMAYVRGLEAQRVEEFYTTYLPDLIANPRGTNSAYPYNLVGALPETNTRYADLLLSGMENTQLDHRSRELRRLLARGLITMTDEGWMANRTRIMALLQDRSTYAENPGLLARAGDYGMEAAPLLLQVLRTGDEDGKSVYGALIGLCRIGAEANTAETRAAMQARWHIANFISESMLVAFLRMGAPLDAANVQVEDNRQVQRWRDEQLASVTPSSPRGVCRTRRSETSDTMPLDTMWD